MSAISLNWFRIGFCLLLFIFPLDVIAGCNTSASKQSMPSSIPVNRGEHRVILYCQLSEQAVLSFRLDVARQATAVNTEGEEFVTLNSASKAFLLPAGQYDVELILNVQRSRFIYPRLDSVPDFYEREHIHLLMMSGFFGFSLALVIFVGVLGRSMHNAGFYAYSAYIASAGMFFFIQEGMLNIVFPGAIWVNDLRVKMLFAGLIVFTGMRFIIRLLDFGRLLRKPFFIPLRIVGIVVLALAVLQAILPENLTLQYSSFMGTLTLAGIAGIVGATVFAVKMRVPAAKLVLVSLLVMFFSMVLRVYLHDINPFLHRYGLVIAVTIEAVLLAVAVSEKVRQLNIDRTRAFRDASYDSLCPVLNRRGWETAADRMLTRHAREGGVLTLLFIDLDRFKQVNDRYGHATGDATLMKVATSLKAVCRERDLIGRYGGDEFVVLSHCPDRQQSQRLFERLQSRCQSFMLNTESGSVRISASVGCYAVEKPHHSIQMLLKQADANMYEHKQASKGTSTL
ncbi:diguanylate cyclase [Aestuariibacter sp. A3R04]|uniref:sensor domain-containing diguanylate cyclase n=1 Tax=Aestuariibacter sp. A3R04 TaxID=2841571 RepID=UPI001C0848DB|nr:diguanylate cyclase [Aestuariibacter sp. A3R04]MBU3020841.1 GGDEF domain-containing protein [Aestuariibacter sp. A3R04]